MRPKYDVEVTRDPHEDIYPCFVARLYFAGSRNVLLAREQRTTESAALEALADRVRQFENNGPPEYPKLLHMDDQGELT